MAPQSKAIVFSDFDGTITMTDSNDHLTDNVGFGYQKRRELNIEVLEDRMTFRDAFKQMLDSVSLPFEECKQLLVQNIRLDPGFKDFYEWCLEKDIPVIILSSGMEPLIRALLEKLVGPKAAQIPIISNQVKIHADKSWEIVYHDDSGFGHDKSLAIKPYANLPKEDRPTLFYCGDGVSDLSAARETDLLFAKAGHDLITFCEREGVPFNVFNDFSDIHKTVKSVVDGEKTLEEVAAAGHKQAEQDRKEHAEKAASK